MVNISESVEQGRKMTVNPWAQAIARVTQLQKEDREHRQKLEMESENLKQLFAKLGIEHENALALESRKEESARRQAGMEQENALALETKKSELRTQEEQAKQELEVKTKGRPLSEVIGIKSSGAKPSITDTQDKVISFGEGKDYVVPESEEEQYKRLRNEKLKIDLENATPEGKAKILKGELEEINRKSLLKLRLL